MSMDKGDDQESHDEFSSSFLQFLADSDPKDDLFPEISSPILAMSTSMAIDVPPEPLQPHVDGDENINDDGGKSNEKELEKENENGAKDEMKYVGKRPRSKYEARNIVEKRRRTIIRTKLTSSCNKGDIASNPSTLDCIIENIRSIKLYVESQSMGMDFPAPWFPSVHSNFYMPPPFNGFTPGETSGHNNQQIAPDTTKGFNIPPQWSKPM